jgi:hypothetical protein
MKVWTVEYPMPDNIRKWIVIRNCKISIAAWKILPTDVLANPTTTNSQHGVFSLYCCLSTLKLEKRYIPSFMLFLTEGKSFLALLQNKRYLRCRLSAFHSDKKAVLTPYPLQL